MPDGDFTQALNQLQAQPAGEFGQALSSIQKAGQGLAGGIPIRRVTPEEAAAAEVPPEAEGAFSRALTRFTQGVERNIFEPVVDFVQHPIGSVQRLSAYTAGAAIPLPEEDIQKIQQEAAAARQIAEADRPELLKQGRAALAEQAARPTSTTGKVLGAVGGFAGNLVTLEPEAIPVEAALTAAGGPAAKGVGKVVGKAVEAAVPVIERLSPKAAETVSAILRYASGADRELPELLPGQIRGTEPIVDMGGGKYAIIDHPPTQPVEPPGAAPSQPGYRSPSQPTSPPARPIEPPGAAPEQAGYRAPQSGSSAATTAPEPTAATPPPPPPAPPQPPLVGRTKQGSGLPQGPQPPSPPPPPSTTPPAGPPTPPMPSRDSIGTTVGNFIKAGLLTSPKTHEVNMLSNAVFAGLEELNRIPSAIADAALSTMTGRRTTTLPSIGAINRGGAEAAAEGYQKAKILLQKSLTPDDLAAIGVDRPANSGSALLDGYMNRVFGTLSVEDKVANKFAFQASLEDRLRAQTLNEIKQGVTAKGDFASRFQQLLQNPPENVVADAMLDASIQTFNNKNIVSEVFNSAKSAFENKGLAGDAAKFAVDVVFPFTKTPVNILARTLDYTPVGIIKENTYQVAKGLITRTGITDAQQRKFAQTIGRSSLGTGLLALGAWLYHSGDATPLYDQEDRLNNARDTAMGRQPGAVRVGNQWVQVSKYGPPGMLISLGATLARQQEKQGGYAGPAYSTFTRELREAPFVQGGQNVGDLLSGNGSAITRAAGGMIGMIVPTGIANVAEALDSKQRQQQGLLGPIQYRTPFLRNRLPEATDVLGQPKQDIGPISAFLDPFRLQTASNNPGLQELLRLDIGISGLKQKPGESPQSFNQRKAAFGEMYLQVSGDLVGDRGYQQADDLTRKTALSIMSERIKRSLAKGGTDDMSSLDPGTLLDAADRQIEKKRQKAFAAQGEINR